MTVEDTFCASILSGEYDAASRAVSDLLKRLKGTAGNQVITFENIKTWLEQHACVREVDVRPGMLRVEPPIKEVFVTIDAPEGPKIKLLSFRVEEKGISFLQISDVEG